MSTSREFWRAQSDQTHAASFDRSGNLTAEGFLNDQGSTVRDWLTLDAFELNQDFGNVTALETPFISVFDNLRDAEQNASLNVSLGHTNVVIVNIRVPRLQRFELDIVKPTSTDHSSSSDENTGCLPALIYLGGGDLDEVTTIVSTRDIVEQFKPDPDLCNSAQHFFLKRVPAELIKSIDRYDGKTWQGRAKSL